MTGVDPTRRTFLRAATAGGAAVVLSAAAGTPARAGTPSGMRVYVLVVDGCRPDEVVPARMPTLAGLRAQGTWYSGAKSMPVMETIPNHVMMMTGVRPDRSGVPANSVYDRAERVVRDLDRASDLHFPTLLTRLRSRGLTTGSVLSKNYLFGVFGTRATYRWEPAPTLPVTGHAPDVFTMDALLAMVDGPDPDFVFANLGDIDRIGHSDVTGTTVAAARSAALTSTDVQIARFVARLKSSGRWERSVLVVLADHSMDWSLPHRLITLLPGLDADPKLTGRVQIAQNGGADLLYWTGAAAQRGAALERMRQIVAATPGVLSVQPSSALRLGARGGDLVAFCKPGYRFSDPAMTSNPIPGNHGHPATLPIPFLVSGGHPAVRRGATSSAAAHTIDVAPTVGGLFGLGAPSGGYDGVARREGFTVPLKDVARTR